ncbi:MAG: Gfo/Idh/MocA family oxidoreductase [Gemmataceae bacterium]|nr:Gfo/Idh/MocA family oxidoreductase [Gemmataceae bacterium]
MTTDPHSADLGRRDFLKTSAAAAALSVAAVPLVHAQGNDILKVGLIGCGGRGTGAATQALSADRGARLWAMGDAFRDRLDSSLNNLRGNAGIANRLDVPRERQFVGFDAYQQVINSGVNVVLLCTPPHFRPAHIRAAVAAGKHIFAEKPVAVDAPGVRAVLAACAEARRRNLSVVSGLCWRYHQGMREVMQRVHDGAVGQIVALQCTYNTGTLWHHRRQPNWSEMEYQVRNWLYYTWLSGDFNVEQHVHSLDKMAWAMRNVYPERCYGVGGRQVRTGPEFGHIYDHMAVTYEFPGGIKCFSMCRQMAGTTNDVSDHIMGTRGTAATMRYRITGERPWTAARETQRDNMYQREHNELFASIRNGNPINNGEWMTKSSLMGIMGRMTCYTGQTITWEQALNSREDLTPARYEWGQVPIPPVARPGVTQFS